MARMQRHEEAGVIISCDFCGTDWDEVLPMIEGHHGSVICLACLERALAEAATTPQTFSCTLCLRDDLPSSLPRWSAREAGPGANPRAVACEECIRQAGMVAFAERNVVASVEQGIVT